MGRIPKGSTLAAELLPRERESGVSKVTGEFKGSRWVEFCTYTLSVLCSSSGLANDSQAPPTDLQNQRQFLTHSCGLSSPKAFSADTLVLAFAH